MFYEAGERESQKLSNKIRMFHVASSDSLSRGLSKKEPSVSTPGQNIHNNSCSGASVENGDVSFADSSSTLRPREA